MYVFTYGDTYKDILKHYIAHENSVLIHKLVEYYKYFNIFLSLRAGIFVAPPSGQIFFLHWPHKNENDQTQRSRALDLFAHSIMKVGLGI